MDKWAPARLVVAEAAATLEGRLGKQTKKRLLLLMTQCLVQTPMQLGQRRSPIHVRRHRHHPQFPHPQEVQLDQQVGAQQEV